MRFNANDHADRFAPILGQHRFRIVAIKNENTKAGDPVILAEMKLYELGRVHFERFITEHANPKVVEISLGKLASLSRSVGIPSWESEHDLVGAAGEAVWGPRKDEPGIAEIKRYVIPGEVKGAASSNPHKTAKAAAPSAAQGIPHPADFSDDEGVPF